MFESVNFAIKQLQRTKKAMGQPELADFKPDGKDQPAVSGLLAALESATADLLAAAVGLNRARGEVQVVWADAHQKCVDLYAALRSVYRSNGAAMRAIRRIPKKDETPRETLTRAEVTAAVWGTLPEMPGVTPPTPFKLGALTPAIFNGAIGELRAKVETCEGCDSVEQVAQGKLADLARADGEFVSAAVAQGRAQYAESSVARQWIETIPLEPSTQPPLQARITAATSPAAGVVHLEFEATSATSFTLQHRLAGEVEFVTVASDVTAESWDFVGLPAGEHQYVVFGVNSRGDGPVSEAATVPVAAQAVA